MYWEVVCVFLSCCLRFAAFRLLLSCAAAACRPAAAAGRCRLSLSLAAAACRLCLSLLLCRCPCRLGLFVLVLSWSLVAVAVARGPWTLVFVTYDLPSLAKPIKRPLWREICPRGPNWLSVHMPGSNRCPMRRYMPKWHG